MKGVVRWRMTAISLSGWVGGKCSVWVGVQPLCRFERDGQHGHQQQAFGLATVAVHFARQVPQCTGNWSGTRGHAHAVKRIMPPTFNH
jgi:hypothetical protein